MEGLFLRSKGNHLEFCRIVIHFIKSTFMYMIYGELARPSLLIQIKNMMVNFWIKGPSQFHFFRSSHSFFEKKCVYVVFLVKSSDKLLNYLMFDYTSSAVKMEPLKTHEFPTC